MVPEKPLPGSPKDWLRLARSDMAVARLSSGPDILLETLCFHTQQTVEKSLKAVLIYYGIEFPKTHNLKILVDLLPETSSRPDEVLEATGLSDYAVTLRYPGVFEPVDTEEYETAVRLAEETYMWAAAIISG